MDAPTSPAWCCHRQRHRGVGQLSGAEISPLPDWLPPAPPQPAPLTALARWPIHRAPVRRQRRSGQRRVLGAGTTAKASTARRLVEDHQRAAGAGDAVLVGGVQALGQAACGGHAGTVRPRRRRCRKNSARPARSVPPARAPSRRPAGPVRPIAAWRLWRRCRAPGGQQQPGPASGCRAAPAPNTGARAAAAPCRPPARRALVVAELRAQGRMSSAGLSAAPWTSSCPRSITQLLPVGVEAAATVRTVPDPCGRPVAGRRRSASARPASRVSMPMPRSGSQGPGRSDLHMRGQRRFSARRWLGAAASCWPAARCWGRPTLGRPGGRVHRAVRPAHDHVVAQRRAVVVGQHDQRLVHAQATGRRCRARPSRAACSVPGDAEGLSVVAHARAAAVQRGVQLRLRAAVAPGGSLVAFRHRRLARRPRRPARTVDQQPLPSSRAQPAVLKQPSTTERSATRRRWGVPVTDGRRACRPVAASAASAPPGASRRRQHRPGGDLRQRRTWLPASAASGPGPAGAVNGVAGGHPGRCATGLRRSRRSLSHSRSG